ncbi:hypothetical protein ISN44_As09g030980, partial [Arabidopsis suecica]
SVSGGVMEGLNCCDKMVRRRTIREKISALVSSREWGWFEASWCRIWGARSSYSASLVLPARDPSRPE